MFGRLTNWKGVILLNQLTERKLRTTSKRPFDICITEDFKHNGEDRTSFHRIGVAFETKNGGFSGQVFPGAALTGRFVILPRKEKGADQQGSTTPQPRQTNMAKSPTRSGHAPAPKAPETSVEGAKRIEAITVPAFDRKDGTGADFSLIVESLFRVGFKMLDGLPQEADCLRIAEKVHAAAYGRFLATEAGREGDTKGPGQPTDQKPGASPLDLELSLPHELTDAQRIDWTRRFITEQFVNQGMIADINIHRPSRDGDDRNHHAHIMLTMRELDGDGFGDKRPEWWGGEKGRKSDRLPEYRAAWAEFQNKEAERLSLPFRVDHRSFEAQGIDRELEQHEGPHATAMKRKQEETRIGKENAEKQARNSARAWQHVEALKDLARIEAERDRFNSWAMERTDHLRAVQAASMRDLTDHHDEQARTLADELDGFYGPHLRTVQAEEQKLSERLTTKGFLPTLRRLWNGRGDREKLDQIRATVADTRQRMDEAKGKLRTRQEVERTRLQELQHTRAQQQREGLDSSRQRKEQVLKPRENAARALWDTATDPEKQKAQAERQRRQAWYESKKEARTEPPAIDGPPKAKVSARDALDRQLHDRAKGIDQTRDNSRLHVNRDVIERVERADHNARYDQNMKAKAEAEAPAKAAELARLRDIAANRMDELRQQGSVPAEGEMTP